MVESKIYIGLNDLASNTQLFENEKYISVLRKVCHSYRVPFLSACRRADIFTKAENMQRKYAWCLLLLMSKSLS